MTDQTSSESPLEAAAGAASERAIEAFELIGNETRLAILLALWEAEPLEPPADRSIDTLLLSFSELRDRVGMRDSGQFNYHLEKLIGPFVYDTGDGYLLRGTGYSIVEAVIAGTGIEGPTLELTEIDVPCELCGAPTAIGYETDLAYQVCTRCEGFRQRSGTVANQEDEFGGLLFAALFDPAGLSDQTPQGIYEASTIKQILRLAAKMAGICPECSGPVEASLSICGTHETGASDICPNCERRSEVRPRFVCPVCKSRLRPVPSLPVGLHPAVIDFYDDHDITIGDWTDPESLRRIKPLVQAQESELISTDPPRVRVTIRHEDDELRLTYDEEVNFIDVSEGT